MSLHTITTDQFGVTEYTGLDFIKVFEHDGVYYGLTATQLLELTGDDDDGTDIAGVVQTGKLHFGTQNLKRVPRIYVNGSADEGLTVTITSTERGGEVNRTYPAALWSGSLRERRVKLARGPKSVHWQFKISNDSGGTMAIDTLDSLVEVLPRRV